MENNNSDKENCKEAKVIQAMLHEAGITKYDPVVVHQLLFFMYDHVTNILENAMVFSEHAHKNGLDNSDILLALKIQREIISPLVTKNLNTELANENNKEPLPEMKPACGIRLPPEKYCLTNTNYKLKSEPKPNPVIIQQPQFLQSPSYLIPACNNNLSRTVLKRSKLPPNIQEQRIVFRPNLKINIKQGENENQMTKKPRTNQ